MRRNMHNMRRNIDCEHKRSAGSVVVAGREDVGEERESARERQRERNEIYKNMDRYNQSLFVLLSDTISCRN